MKLLRNLFIYGCLMMSLTACPFLEEPASLRPLATAKTQKESFKNAVCRPKTAAGITFSYTADGKLSTATTEFGANSYEYDANGFLTKETETYPGFSTVRQYAYTYDAQGRLARRVESVGNVPEFEMVYQNGQLQGCFRFVGGVRGPNQCAVDGQGRMTKLENNLLTYNANGTVRTLTFSLSDMVFSFEYDDKLNPTILLPVFKGHPRKHEDLSYQPHNITKVEVRTNTNLKVL
jgi:YD repeat-containing protein